MSTDAYINDGMLDETKKNLILKYCKRSVLEVGCNTGELAGYLNSIGIYAEGVDINDSFIGIAKSKYPNVKFHCGADFSIFKDNQFETVIAWDVLEHISDDGHALKEFSRIASLNVALSVPKEDQISLPYSCVTYRPYVDPTHVHFYTKERLENMVNQLGDYKLCVEDTYRVRPLMAYEKIGIPRIICSLLDKIFWRIGKNKEILCANLVAEISKK